MMPNVTRARASLVATRPFILAMVVLTGVASAAERGDFFREGPWIGGPVEDGADQYCVMTGPFDEDGTMSIALGLDDVLLVVFEQKSWRLPRKLGPRVNVKLGRHKVQTVLADRASTKELTLMVVDKGEFLRGLRKAKTLTIEDSEYQISIALKPSAKAVDRLAACAAKGFDVADAPGRDPFALPVPKLFTPENVERLKQRQ